jgi:hypothetical protein
MKHKADKDIEKSLRGNLTLLHKENSDSFLWATYDEIETFLKEGYEIFNDEKRELYGR